MANLLDRASVVLTPTAYNNGEALCIKPDDGSGDFQFSRNSAATRDNDEGLVEDISIFSGEIITNGSFDTDTNWTLGTGFSISGGSANCDGSQVANTELKQQGGVLGATIDFVVGKTYKVNFDVIVTSGRISTIEVASSYDSNRITTSGNHTAYITAASTNNRFTITTNSDFIGSIDNVSVVEIIEATNIPRINYENGCGSWLFEPQSTNLITQSELFSDSSWNKTNSSVVSGFTSPSGDLNAFKLINNATASVNKYIRTIPAATSGIDYSLSVFAKKGEYDKLRIEDGNNSQGAWFDLSNGTFSAVGSSVVAKIEDYGNGWYKCSVAKPSVTTSVFFIIAGSNSQSLQVGDGTSGVYIWGAQLEQQSYATSYIPTNGEANGVTRNQDVCNNGGSLATINSTEGVLYAEIAALADDGTSRRITLLESLNNKVSLILSSTSNSIQGLVISGGSVQFNQTFATSNILDFNKIAVSYAENNFALWVNGVKVRTDTSGVTFSENTLTNISFADGNNTSNKFFGKTKCVAVFPYLTDAELTELTTI